MEISLKSKIEQEFERGNIPTELPRKVPFDTLITWEATSPMIQEGLEKMHYWESYFGQSYPITYERIRKSSNKKRWENMWKELLVTEKKERGIWQDVVPKQLADEFGLNSTVIPKIRFEAFSESAVMRVIGVYALNQQHLKDHSFWALNHNTLREDPEDFLVPPYLDGDPTFQSVPLICAIESQRLTLVVILRHREIQLYDHFKQSEKEKRTVRHWRHLVTDELWTEKAIPIVASCFVLDAYLLFASADGKLRAKPRNNPESTYMVQDIKSLVIHMVSLYNVVAIVYSFNVLEVRFFETLFKEIGVDSRTSPLLYGPFVVYQSFDGWVKRRYDPKPFEAEPVKVPFRAGWMIINIKNANWKYWSIVLKNPQTNKEEEYQFGLKSGGGIAMCIDCGIKARYLCSACEDVGYCEEHKKEHGCSI